MWHGEYTLCINGNLFGYGGYYDESESTHFCTNDNDVSFCITPNYCNNIRDLYVSEGLDEVDINSFKAITNNSELIRNSNNYDATLVCNGERSCINSDVEFYEVGCYGGFSCERMNVTGNGTLNVYCEGVGSCNDMIVNLKATSSFQSIYVYGVAAIGPHFTETVRIQGWQAWNLYSPLGIMNSKITLAWVQYYVAYISGYYSLFNVHFSCDYTGGGTEIDWFQVTCYDENNPLWITFDDECDWYNPTYANVYHPCTILTSKEEINGYDIGSYKMMDEMYQLAMLSREYSNECDNASISTSISRDIGYSLYAEQEIVNEGTC